MVRTLASHQCRSSSISEPGVICGLSLLLVLDPAPRVFSGLSNTSKIQFVLEFEGHRLRATWLNKVN